MSRTTASPSRSSTRRTHAPPDHLLTPELDELYRCLGIIAARIYPYMQAAIQAAERPERPAGASGEAPVGASMPPPHAAGSAWQAQPDGTLPKLAVTPKEAARMLSISYSRLYTLIMRGEIASFKAGRSRLIPLTALKAFIRERCQESATWTSL